MKFLFITHGWTAESYLAEVERRLGYKLDPPVAEEEPDGVYRDHVGIHAQRDGERSYAGFSVTSGRVTPDQLRHIASLAWEFGSGAVRLTATQNIIILGIPNDRLAAFRTAVSATGLALAGSPFQRGMVSCTGTEFCKLALTETKRFSIDLASELEQRIPGFGAEVKVHVTGCPNSCGQHWIADIGLQGIMLTRNGEQVEGYDVFIGGAAGRGSAIARRVGHRVAASETASALERLFRGFEEDRSGGEPFRSWAARTADERVKALLG